MSLITSERNWAGNYTYGASRIHRPRTVTELQELVGAGGRVRALGTRHSFTDIADSDRLISLADLKSEITIDGMTGTVSTPGHVTYAELAETLHGAGRALANLASLPHISIAGAVSTATHGSGDTKGNLATSVTGLELVSGTGELIQLSRGDADFDGAVVGLGALGVITRVQLETEPYYEIAQRVYEYLPWAALVEHYDEITAAGESVSVFHRFGDCADQVWVKTRVGPDAERDDREDLFGAQPADGPRTPIPSGEVHNCTEQLGVPGPWSERLNHFRSGYLPSSGEELQSEFFVDRAALIPAVEALRRLEAKIRPLLVVSELRTMTADQLWLSPCYRRTTAAIHFTWLRRTEQVEAAVTEIEDALRPFAARPHWGKLFHARADEMAGHYERLDDFRRLRARLDPDGVFVNRWLSERVLGPG